MSINVRVKNNTRGNGYDSFNGFNTLHGVSEINECGTFGGITGVDTLGRGNWYGQSLGAGLLGLQNGTCGSTMLNGMHGDLSLLGSRAGLNLGMLGGMNQYGIGESAFMSNLSKEQVFITSLAGINAQLAQAARQIGMIDAGLISELAQIAFVSKALAIRILEVAIANIAVARTLVRVAAIDVQLASSIAMTALMNIDVAVARLQSLGLVVDSMGYAGITGLGSVNGVRANVQDKGNAWVIEADMAGLNLADVDITVDGRVLVIEAAANAASAGTFGNGMTWSRRFMLGTDIKVDDISARTVNGVLSIVLPKLVADCTTSAVRNVCVAA